jgi:hypothetical protein
MMTTNEVNYYMSRYSWREMVELFVEKKKRVEELEAENLTISDEVGRVRHIAEQQEELLKIAFEDLRASIAEAKKLDELTSTLARHVNYFKRDMVITMDYWRRKYDPIEPVFAGGKK